MDALLPVALTVGLLSSLHCIGMCGGIMGALTFGLPPEVRGHPRQLAAYVAAYNLGRLLSYACAGGLFGLFGAELFRLVAPWLGQGWPQRLAALAVLLMGLHIAGWLPQLIALERLGRPLWHRLQPLAQGLMPVRSLPRALLYGMLWGWLPCGLVYSMLIVAAGQGSAPMGGLLMLVFGMGTLPSVMLTGLLAGRIQVWSRRPGLRTLSGALLALFGLLVLLYPALFDWRALTPAL